MKTYRGSTPLGLENLDRRHERISDTIKQLLLTTGAAITISRERRKCNEMFTEV